SILSIECITVVWCLPPNWRPISGKEASVKCLVKYIATCRGYTMEREMFLVLISPDRSPNCSATAVVVHSTVILLVRASMKVLNLGQCLGWAIAGDHDLLHGVMQRVEGVEKLFLSALLLGQELDVIHQQHVHIAELIAETDHLVVAQRIDHLVGELLAAQIADVGLRRAPLHFVATGLHQVGFAHSHAAIEEQ